MSNIVALFQVLIGYIDSKTFVNLSMTCRTANRICTQNVNQLKFKHGIISQPIKSSCTQYWFYADGNIVCRMSLHDRSRKKNGITTVYRHDGQYTFAFYNYRQDILSGVQHDTTGREWFVKNRKAGQAEPDWKLSNYMLGIDELPISYPKKDINTIEKYHKTLLTLLQKN